MLIDTSYNALAVWKSTYIQYGGLQNGGHIDHLLQECSTFPPFGICVIRSSFPWRIVNYKVVLRILTHAVVSNINTTNDKVEGCGDKRWSFMTQSLPKQCIICTHFQKVLWPFILSTRERVLFAIVNYAGLFNKVVFLFVFLGRWSITFIRLLKGSGIQNK